MESLTTSGFDISTDENFNSNLYKLIQLIEKPDQKAKDTYDTGFSKMVSFVYSSNTNYYGLFKYNGEEMYHIIPISGGKLDFPKNKKESCNKLSYEKAINNLVKLLFY